MSFFFMLLALCAAASYASDGSAPECAGAIVAGCLVGGISLGVSDGRAAYRPSLDAWFSARQAALREEPVQIEGVQWVS